MNRGNGKTKGTVYSHVLEILKPYDASGRVAIDIGCGYGAYAKHLKSDYIGIDVRERDCDGDERIIHANAQEMPLKSDFADLIFTVGALYQIPDADAVLEESYRVLKKKGNLVVFDYNRGTTNRLKRTYSESGIRHTHVWSPWQLSSRIRDVGFSTKIVWDYATETDVLWKRYLMKNRFARLLRFLYAQLGEGWNIVVATKQ